MGYYVTLNAADFEISNENLEAAYNALCALNFRNDLKHGAVYPRPENLPNNIPNEYQWFAWMPWNYHETMSSVSEILTALGFEVFTHSDGAVSVHSYDDKAGNEEIFIEALAPYCSSSFSNIPFMEWIGEDHERERWEFPINPLNGVRQMVKYYSRTVWEEA
jgi:hypothetical protein